MKKYRVKVNGSVYEIELEEIKAGGEISDLTYTPVPGGIGRVTTSISPAK